MATEENKKRVSEREAESETTYVQCGTMFPNGNIAWSNRYDTKLFEKDEREYAQRAYDQELTRLGIEHQKLVFVAREAVTTYTKPKLIVDPED